MKRALIAMVSGTVFAAYPFVSAYLAQQGWIRWELALLAGLTLWRSVSFKSWRWRIGAWSLALALLGGAYLANAYFVWLMPSLIYLWLAGLFGHTLMIGPSICERLVRLQFPEFKPGISEYLRQVTWVWTLFFAVNIPLCAVLPLIWDQNVWALYTGGIVYLLMGLLMYAEWRYRHRRFPDLEIPPMLETASFMMRNMHRVFQDEH